MGEGSMSLTAVHDGDLSRAAAPTPAAERQRQRRHRARRKQGEPENALIVLIQRFGEVAA